MAGIDIGPIHIGGDATPQAKAAALTIAQIQKELPQGVTLYQVTTHDATGKVVNDRAPTPDYVLRPGDAIELRGNGKQWLTHVNGDASDIDPPTEIGTPTKTAPAISLPTTGTPLERQTATRDAALTRYNDPDTPQSEKSGLLALVHSADAEIDRLSKADQTAAGKDADTQALAQAAAAKFAAGKGDSLSQGELAAYFKVHGGSASGQPGKYVLPIAGYSGDLTPHHAGEANGATDLFAPPGTQVVATTSGVIKRAGPFGAAGNNIVIQGDDGRTYDYEHVDGVQVKPGDKVTTGQPLAVVATLEKGGASVGDATHLHFAVGATPGSVNYDNHGTAADFDTLGFLKSLQQGQQPSAGLSGNPFSGSAKPEIHALGNKLYQYDPNSGKWSVAVDATDLATPTTHQIGNTLYQWDPGKRTWSQAIVGPKSAADIQAEQLQQGKFQTLLQQADSTRAYIKQQYLSGTITAQQMADYGQSLDQYTNAALEGTTPWERYQQQQQLDNSRAATAKDLLDTKLQQTTTMADSMLGHALSGLGEYGGRHLAPDALSGLYQGIQADMDQRAKPLTDLAQTLLHGISTHAAAAGLDPRIPPMAPPPGSPAAGASPGTPAAADLIQYLQSNPGNITAPTPAAA